MDELIRENIELRARLELAEKWMRREVATSISRIQEEHSHKDTRIALKNIFEAEWLDILTRKVIQKFDSSLSHAPRYTLERLIDAEIYWNTLQQYPQMDALPVIMAYQKILDAWIEEVLVAPWRVKNKKRNLLKSFTWIEQDLSNIIEKKYSLSIGRLYQILLFVRNNDISWELNLNFIAHLRSLGILDICISDKFFLPFQTLIEKEVFSRKRHESKVNYSDAQFIREVMIDASDEKWLFEMLFSI